MAGAVIVNGTLIRQFHKVPSFNYSNVGFTVTDTTTATLVLLDIKGLNYIHCLIENVSADGAANELHWGVIAYLHDNDIPSANSALEIIAADTVIATTALGQFILAVNAMDTTNETPLAPTIHEILPAARLGIYLDAEGTDIVTANIWMQGNL